MKSSNVQLMKTSEALVFDIKRFAVHDGSGIRTTIFFKGCPLRCLWCHNPEGLSFKKDVIYLESRCIHCRLCERAGTGQLIYKNDRPYFNHDVEDFDNLVAICPSTAIRYDAVTYDCETLMAKIRDDRVFYRNNGGVTFSGGEPLMQKGFLKEMLMRCQEEGIHTAIETSLYAPWDVIEPLLGYLDLIYTDMKVADDTWHRYCTGVSNDIIKDNMRRLLASEVRDKVIVRTPLIPGYTATDDNIAHIAAFLHACYKDVHYELLNYNPLANAKYDLYDYTYGVAGDVKMLTKQEMQHFHQIALDAGIKHLITE